MCYNKKVACMLYRSRLCLKLIKLRQNTHTHFAFDFSNTPDDLSHSAVCVISGLLL